MQVKVVKKMRLLLQEETQTNLENSETGYLEAIQSNAVGDEETKLLIFFFKALTFGSLFL